MPNTLQSVLEKTFGMHQRYSPWRKGTVFYTDWRRQNVVENQAELNHHELCLLIIMIKIDNECVSKCILHCLEQTESKYGEALAHSDGGLTTQILWCEKSEMKGTNIFFFCQKFLTYS